MTNRRRLVEREVLDDLRRRVDQYGLGLEILRVTFQDVHPPLAVVDAYRDVSRAESERRRRAIEAQTYRAERIQDAHGRADATVNRAEGEGSLRQARAQAEAEAFSTLDQARAGAPALTDLSLYWDAVAATLANKTKLVLDPAGDRRRHVIIPELPLETALPALNLEDANKKSKSKSP